MTDGGEEERSLLASVLSLQLSGAAAADLVEFPVELSWFVVLGLRWLLAEEKDQPAVVDVKGVVVSVHLCSTEKERSRDQGTNRKHFTSQSKSHKRERSNYTFL